jgi:hypothetical protein
MTFFDYKGQPIEMGDTVGSNSYGYGTPMGVTRGTVVGFGRTKVKVCWDGFVYGGQWKAFDTSRPDMLRVIGKEA